MTIATSGLNSTVRRVALVAATLVAAGSAGWLIAGPPHDGTAVVPPGCPSTYVPAATSGGDAAVSDRLPGVRDQLVPMPLPQPRGPVSARICRFQAQDGGYRLQRSAIVEPVRTSSLAALLNTPGRLADDERAGACPPSPGIDVLIFRYTEGLPMQVDVVGGTCGLVRTPTRAETGRQDVVRRVDELLDLQG
jgi:hypothetical protein